MTNVIIYPLLSGYTFQCSTHSIMRREHSYVPPHWHFLFPVQPISCSQNSSITVNTPKIVFLLLPATRSTKISFKIHLGSNVLVPNTFRLFSVAFWRLKFTASLLCSGSETRWSRKVYYHNSYVSMLCISLRHKTHTLSTLLAKVFQPYKTHAFQVA